MNSASIKKNEMANNKNIKTNSVLNVIKTISSIVIPVITFPYLSRTLQLENIGKVNFAQSYISYFALIASLGISTYAIRECSTVRSNRKEFDQRASEIYSINVCTTIISYLLLIFSLFVFEKIRDYKNLIMILSVSIALTTVGTDWINTAAEDFLYITVRTIAFQAISMILIFVFVKKPEDCVKYAWISVLSSSGVNLSNVFYRKRFCTIHFTARMKFREHFKPILLLFVMILAQNVFKNADVTMLGLMKGDAAVGIYSTAVKIENIIAQVVASLVWVVMPKLSIYFAEKDYVKINMMLKKISEVFLLIGLPSIAGVFMLSKEIVVIVGGEQYIAASTPLIILMISFFIDLFGGSFLGNMTFLPSGNEKKFMIICCITAVANVILNYTFIPIWGVNAAAGTTALSALIIMVLLVIYRDKNIDISYWRTVTITPLVGSVAICIVCFCIKQIINNLYLRVGGCVLGSVFVYVILMIALKNPIAVEVVTMIKRKMFGTESRRS